MARILSVDIVMSATTMYQIACRSRFGEGAASGGSLASHQNFHRDPQDQQTARD